MKETVRDRIKSIANDPHIKERYDMYTDMVLGDLREALLSEAAIEAAARYMYVDGGNQGVWEEERETYQNRYRGRAETTLEVALAAITGGWKDGFKANE